MHPGIPVRSVEEGTLSLPFPGEQRSTPTVDRTKTYWLLLPSLYQSQVSTMVDEHFPLEYSLRSLPRAKGAPLLSSRICLCPLIPNPSHPDATAQH
jgi:hypothetical protein